MVSSLTGSTVGRVLVIDGDAREAKGIARHLVASGHSVRIAGSLAEGRDYLATHPADLVIMDLALTHGKNGTGWVGLHSVPVIIIADPEREDDIVQSLVRGASDFVARPISGNDLVTRTRLLLRRAQSSRQSSMPPPSYRDNYLAINVMDRRVMVDGRLVQLTPTEQGLLGHFLTNVGRVLTYDELLQEVWGPDYRGYPDYVRIYVWRLRNKVEKNPKDPQYILTEHGIGYRFEAATQ